MPIPTGDVREAMTWEGRRMAVFAKANNRKNEKVNPFVNCFFNYGK